MRIVNVYKDTIDEENYGYALCSCLNFDEGLEIPRPDETQFIRVICPQCGRSLGITLRGKVDNTYIELRYAKSNSNESSARGSND